MDSNIDNLYTIYVPMFLSAMQFFKKKPEVVVYIPPVTDVINMNGFVFIIHCI